MFFFFDIDGLFEGFTAKIGLIMTIVILFVVIGIPLYFLESGGFAVLLSLYLGLTLAIFLLSIYCLYNSIKLIFNKNIEKEYYKKNRSKIYLILFITTTLIGIFMPSNITIFHFKFELVKWCSIIQVPLIADIFYIFAINCEYKIKKYGINFWDSLKKLFSSLFYPTLVIYWAFIIFSLIATDSDNLHQTYVNATENNKIGFRYYNNQYEEYRNYLSVDNYLEQNILEYTNNIPSSEEKIKEETSKVGSGSFSDLFWNSDTDKRFYTYAYIDTSIKASKEIKNAGIKIEDNNIIDENTIYLQFYDKATLRERIVKFDLQNCKIVEEATYVDFRNQFYINRSK